MVLVMVVLVVLALALVVTWGVVLALAGRSSFPRRERLPLREWGVGDLRANVVRGFTMVGSVGTVQTTKR